MKSAADYLAPHVFEARRPRRELQPVVSYPAAVAAIEQALADAEKYKYLLMRALRHHADEAKPVRTMLTADNTAFFAHSEAPVVPLYPLPVERMAA